MNDDRYRRQEDAIMGAKLPISVVSWACQSSTAYRAASVSPTNVMCQARNVRNMHVEKEEKNTGWPLQKDWRLAEYNVAVLRFPTVN
jgi:hypothetical protein